MKQKLVISKEFENVRADIALSSLLGITRSALKNRIQDGIIVNGKTKALSHLCHEKDVFEVEIKEQILPSLEPEPIPLSILFEDETLLVINKQAGLVVHAGGGTQNNTLVNGLIYHLRKKGGLKEFGDTLRPGIVHRLDKDTSGVMVIAKTLKAMENLQKQFASRTIEKEYRAIVSGNIRDEEITVDQPIGRHPTERKKMTVLTTLPSRKAYTSIRVLEHFNEAAYVAAFPKTGRTHQIRVHLAYIKHPILGDEVYGSHSLNQNFKAFISRQALHARRLKFQHPLNEKTLEFTAPLPKDMQTLLEALKQ